MTVLEILALVIGIVLAVIIGALGLLIVRAVYKGQIDLKLLICEKDGPASISRFQLLIFTFVIALALFYLVVQNGEFPAISTEILTLLGISGGTYVISKGIHKSGKPGE